MTRITNADQVLALLRNHLERAQRRRGRGSSAKAPLARESTKVRIRGLAQTGSLPQGEIERAMIAGLLVDAFGDAAANDPRFQAMVDEVQRILSDDPNSRALLTSALERLTGRG